MTDDQAIEVATLKSDIGFIRNDVNSIKGWFKGFIIANITFVIIGVFNAGIQYQQVNQNTQLIQEIRQSKNT